MDRLHSESLVVVLQKLRRGCGDTEGTNFIMLADIMMIVLSSLLQRKWEGVLHHVCGDHDWIMDRCAHKELTEQCSDRYGNALEYFSKGELVHISLQDVVLNARFLNSLKYYTNFRCVHVNLHCAY